jgi:hypothetical protein
MRVLPDGFDYNDKNYSVSGLSQKKIFADRFSKFKCFASSVVSVVLPEPRAPKRKKLRVSKGLRSLLIILPNCPMFWE